MCKGQARRQWATWHLLLSGMLTVVSGLLSTTTLAQASAGLLDNEEMPWFRNQPESDKYVVIVTGAAASEEIRSRFRQWSVGLYDVLLRDYGYGADNIYLLLDDGENIGYADHRVSGSSRVEDMMDVFDGLREELAAGDQLTVIFIGHGSSTFGDAKFNNVGPDITGEEFSAVLDGFGAQDIVVVNAFSASFEFARALSAPGRVIISATRSRAERYDPVFPRFFIEGLEGHAADRDRNGRVSMLEAFSYASNSVADWYRMEGRLGTENAVLDDNGDGMFTREPGSSERDGLLAEIAYLDVITADETKTSPEAIALRGQMQDLERSVFILRNQKANYLESEYWNRLEALLVELARITRRYNELP